MPPTTPSLDSIVADAVELADDARRAAFLAEHCGGDANLRSRAEALISAHFSAGRFLESTAASESSSFDETGASIGPYRLLEKLGEGGMGDVYVAEQMSPVKRRVALKIIKPGMDTREVIARFEAERQALALMDHPNIAKVFDGGATPTGRPYFVMELVRGLPITDYCDQAKLSPDPRLKLFVQVCRAVQHAHQKGVIHRDLKPSNILITLHDGEPMPKVIDFGVAKAIGERLTEHSAYTRFTQMIGTPLYMSPEQAELSALDVDTRSDVYSLGVLLYELLTGTTPFDQKTFREAGFDEMRRIIREDEPPKPSARLSTLDAQARSTVSSRRGIDERQLGRQLRGDLDWIAMKALEKDRNRRYESAGAFAADVERYLANEPIEARPPSVGYRLRKFVRRNRGSLVATAAALAAVLAVSSAFVWSSRDRSAKRMAANREGEVALAEADQFWSERRWQQALACALRAEAALSVADGDPVLRSQAQSTVADMRMAVALDHARLQNAVGIWRSPSSFDNKEMFNVPARLAGYESSFRNYGIDILSMAPEAAAEKIRVSRIREELVQTLYNWASVSTKLKLAQGPQLLAVAHAADSNESPSRRLSDAHAAQDRKAVEEIASSTALDDQPITFLLRLADELKDLVGRDAAIEFMRKVQRRHADDFWVNHDLARLFADGKPPRHQEAIEFYRAALAVRPRSAGTHLNLGQSLIAANRINEGADAFREAIRIQPDYAGAHFSLGLAARDNNRMDEAIAEFREAVRLAPGDAEFQSVLGAALINVGDNVAGAGRLKEAVNILKEAIRLNPDKAASHHALGLALMRQGNHDAAITSYREALRLNPDVPYVHFNLAIALKFKWRLDEAIAESQAGVRANPSHFEGHYNLASSLNDAGRFQEAESAYREAMRLRPDIAETMCNLGKNLTAQGRIEEGLAILRKGHEIGTKKPGWPYNSALWVEDLERLAKMGPRLALVINQEAQPADTDEASTVLAHCYNKHSFATAERLYAWFCRTIWEKDENAASHRFMGAFAAARAGCGQGDGALLDPESRAKLRRHALSELRVVFHNKALQIQKKPEEAALLRNWYQRGDLACVREPDQLAALPELERAEWTKLWSDVKAVLDKSRKPATKTD